VFAALKTNYPFALEWSLNGPFIWRLDSAQNRDGQAQEKGPDFSGPLSCKQDIAGDLAWGGVLEPGHGLDHFTRGEGYKLSFPNPGSDARRIDRAVQSDFNVGAILHGALLNNDGAVNGKSLVHFDHRDVSGVCPGHVMVWGYGSNCSCC
jgi:hypothetical protein